MVDASTVASAAKWIASSLIEEGQYLYGVEYLVRDLQTDLECMQELLQKVDANPSLVKEDGQLRIFTKKIRELAFRAEDAIDTYIVDVGAKVYMKNFFFKLACLMSHSYPLHTLRKEIEAIQHDIQHAKKRFETFGMIIPNTSSSHQHGNSNIGSSTSCLVPIENYIHLDDEVVVGIDDVIRKLVERLADPHEDFRVLGIVGTGGAGKSTLATQLYRHNKVASLFPHRAFVSISQKWSRTDLLRRIFKQIKGESIPPDESDLVEELRDFMKDKQCLVVLDDIWKKEAWDDIYPIFPHSNEVCCRVILTTRIEEVPLHAHNKCIIHEPQLLTEDQKWELFSKVAMEGRADIEQNVRQYEKLGRQLLEKCQGLPLAVVTLAGVLRTKRAVYKWEEVSKACNEYILKGKGAPNYGVVENMLELSYLDLPSYLKPCFLYLAIFPEDEGIEAHQSIRLWIAEGFITNELLGKGHGTLEDVGMRLLDELAHRCILQVTGRNARAQIESFRLHDLMRELCLEKAKEHQFVATISSQYPDVSGRNQQRRIAVYSREKFPTENPCLRTVVDFDKRFDLPDEATIRMLEHLGHCKLLRVLFLSGDDPPKRIGKLIHLRFLAVLGPRSHELPKSIKNLRNLLHLQYFFTLCNRMEVPNNLFCNMENLRELILPRSLKRGGSKSFNCTLGLSGCKNLQSLESGAGTWMMKDLPTLSLSVRSLTITDIETVEEMEAIYQCPSVMEDRLCRLKCSVGTINGLTFDLQRIRHCKTLWSLRLDNCALAFGNLGAPELPPNLVSLFISCSPMNEPGYDLVQELSNLKTLSLETCLGKRLSCKASAFPQLQELSMHLLFHLEEWIMEEGAMPHLTKLYIGHCSELKRLPESLRSITTLKELTLEGMSEEFCERLRHEGPTVGEDYYIIQDIPSVKLSAIKIIPQTSSSRY